MVQTSNYTILAIINVSECNSLTELYNQLANAKKEVFSDQERIIINYGTDKHLALITELLSAIDIPEFFVIFNQVISNEPTIDFVFEDSFCIYPWINLRINTLGQISPCCKFDATGLAENINNNSIKEVYLGNTMSAVREAMRNGQRPKQCNVCWQEESVGLESMRQNGKYKFREIYHKLNYETDNFDNLQLVDLNLSNACNLSCRNCDPVSSSSIATLDRAAGRLSNQQFIELKQAVNWSETSEFWDQLLSTAQNLKYLDLYGGEPMMSKNHFNFLKKLINLGVANNIQIDYNSNGTIYSEKFFDLWSHFKSVKISFSIDDIEDRFVYQRNGANWLQVLENINLCKAKVNNKFTIDIFTTISIQNIYYLPELIQWAQTINLPISFGILNVPTFLSIQNIPTTAISTIIEKLLPFTYIDIIASVITILEQGTSAGENIEFINYMKMLDLERQQDFAKSHTDIAKAIGY
jgi:organic radical activating enzyme